MSTVVGPVAAAATTAKPESFLQKIEGVFSKDGKKFLSVMELIGKDAAKGLSEVVAYLPTVSSLAAIFFPGEAAAATAAVSVVDVIQKAVVTVEAKYAASGISQETGSKKAADVLLLVEASVTALLAQLGITANTAYIQNIVNGVVAILNVQSTTATA